MQKLELSTEEIKEFRNHAAEDEVAEMPLQFLLTGVLFLTVAGIASAYATKIESDVQATFTVDSLPYNVTRDAMEGQANITSNFDIVGLIIAAVVVLGLIVGLFTLVR